MQTVEEALELNGAPVYVRKEIVHNQHVVHTLEERGAIFVDETDEVPEGALVIFSAHGVAPVVHEEAAARNLRTIDATCPLVTKVHNEARRFAEDGFDILLIGHDGHEEVIGTTGEAPDRITLVGGPGEASEIVVANPEKIAWLSQTTLSVDDTRGIINSLKERFPEIHGPDVKDICYATQNRQHAMRELAEKSDVILVLGAKNSSNSNRLRDLGEDMNIPSYLIDDADGLESAWLTGKNVVGITAGASAPEALVDELIAKLRTLADIEVQMLDGVTENIHFKLPRQLKDVAAAAAQ